MLKRVLGGLLAMAATTAAAEEKLLTGPPPAWVRPGADIKPGPPPAEGLALRTLRLDRQLNFGPSGDGIYLEAVTQVRTAAGLPLAGTVLISWDPSRQAVTLHKLRIVRPDQTIDLLARQSFTVVRREANFRQIVDGRLTATLQPEDLRVGDQLEFAYSVTHSDPVMKGRTDVPLNLDGLRNFEETTLRATWPASEPITWRAGSGLPAPKVVRRGGEMELTLAIKDQARLEGPKGAPRRYWPTRDLEFSEFKTWADVAATVADQFQKASVLAPDSPLRAEVARIRAASSDPKAQAAAALKLVQDEVRYLALILTDGGYIPVDADKTWERRFGECKAKSVLLVALLRELGIEAEPVLVNALNGEGLDRTLPRMSAFNHVIVRAVIGGKTYWLDGTRTGQSDLDDLAVPGHRWALPLRAKGAELIPLVQPAPAQPLQEVNLDIDARAGIDVPAPVKGELVMRGDSGLIPAMLTANATPADRERTLKALWARYPWIEVKTVEVKREADTTRIVMDGTAKLRWQNATNGLRWFVWPNAVMGQRTDYKRDPGPGADAPYAVPFPQYATSRLSIRVPGSAGEFATEAPDVSKTVAGREWRRRTTRDGDRIQIEASVKALASEFPFAEAETAAAELETMAAAVVAIQTPRGYRASEADIAAWAAETPRTPADHILRGNRYGQANRLKEALADFDRAVALDPKSVPALAGRAFVHMESGRADLARQDLDAAAKINPRSGAVQNTLGALALREGRFQDAVAALTRAAELTPNNINAIVQRADAYRQLGDNEKALADLETALQIDPQLARAHGVKAQVHAGAGDYDNALKAIDAGLAVAPNDAAMLSARGSILARLKRPAEAEAAFAAADRIAPNDPSVMSLRVRSYEGYGVRP